MKSKSQALFVLLNNHDNQVINSERGKFVLIAIQVNMNSGNQYSINSNGSTSEINYIVLNASIARVFTKSVNEIYRTIATFLGLYQISK